MYFIKTPKLLKHLYSNGVAINDSTEGDEKLYLTFDDGPNPNNTPFILETLAQFNIEATFFCIGEQIINYPNLFEEIKKQGHQVGNHTFNHLKGWDVSNFTYYKDIIKAETLTKTKLFRPPYGQIKQQQLRTLRKHNFKTFLWDVMPGDFDKKVSKEVCLENAIKHTEAGTNIVFHDNDKSSINLKYSIPRYIETMLKKGFEFCAL